MALDGFLLSLHALVDTHDAEAWAWSRTLAAEGFTIPSDRLSVALARDPEDLVFTLLGAKVEAMRGARLRAAKRDTFLEYLGSSAGAPGEAGHARAPVASVSPSARELLRDLHRRGIETALVGAFDAEELRAVEQASGIAWAQEIDVVALPSEGTRRSIADALVLLGMTPAQCAFLGRAWSEVRVAHQMGVVSVATTQGRGARSALARAGARVVKDDLQRLALCLDRTLRVLSPAAIRFGAPVLDGLMREALALAEQNLAQFRAPHGAVVASGTGEIKGRGRDLSDTHGPLAHAELEAMRMGLPQLRRGEGAILATTAAPCPMCLAAAAECGIDTVLFGGRGATRASSLRLSAGAFGRAPLPRVVGGVLERECEALLTRFRAADESGSRLTRSRRAVLEQQGTGGMAAKRAAK